MFLGQLIANHVFVTEKSSCERGPGILVVVHGSRAGDTHCLLRVQLNKKGEIH